MSAVWEMGEGSHSWGWGQGSRDQKLLLSAQSWAHFTGGRRRPWPSWHQVLSQQLHPGFKVPLGLATFPAMSQGLRGWALGPAAQVPYPSMTSCVTLSRHCTSLGLCGKKGESLRLREDVRIKQHPSHSFIHSLTQQTGTKPLQCARCCSRNQGHRWAPSPSPGAAVLVAETDPKLQTKR